MKQTLFIFVLALSACVSVNEEKFADIDMKKASYEAKYAAPSFMNCIKSLAAAEKFKQQSAWLLSPLHETVTIADKTVSWGEVFAALDKSQYFQTKAQKGTEVAQARLKDPVHFFMAQTYEKSFLKFTEAYEQRFSDIYEKSHSISESALGSVVVWKEDKDGTKWPYAFLTARIENSSLQFYLLSSLKPYKSAKTSVFVAKQTDLPSQKQTFFISFPKAKLTVALSFHNQKLKLLGSQIHSQSNQDGDIDLSNNGNLQELVRQFDAQLITITDKEVEDLNPKASSVMQAELSKMIHRIPSSLRSQMNVISNLNAYQISAIKKNLKPEASTNATIKQWYYSDLQRAYLSSLSNCQEVAELDSLTKKTKTKVENQTFATEIEERN